MNNKTNLNFDKGQRPTQNKTKTEKPKNLKQIANGYYRIEAKNTPKKEIN